MPGKAATTKLPTPPPTQPLQSNPADHKRKMEQKGKEIVEIGRTHPSQKDEPHRGAKQAKGMQTRSSSEGERRGDHQAVILAWVPSLVLKGAPLPSDASIRDF